ncbi:DUF4062 domain-containing protein [Cellulosimicrobium sp. CUA-896]|uniref:DUF4062 domain-containing protein n=1 Tax=Cellulosimicrobium sp. CUA-896 TaxID=1517881 RepID=UPI0009648073|nr:DUF4062 domain-containing protein [Cellulosimicrobium sp. CUA-896]OLT53272.1 hypothetical protein BJF88_12510 [Cellulosimicrobium sp. CUA-896]
MDPSSGSIRTPDQRLRVFVSSTLKELAPERRAVRAAVERLHLAPVMFELGARPHPPRALYRSYLGQSDVFVGIYGERYGWVAPGEDVSGLEDEYRLAPPSMPRLVYVKETAGAREPRLVELLDRIKGDDTASYTSFADATRSVSSSSPTSRCSSPSASTRAACRHRPRPPPRRRPARPRPPPTRTAPGRERPRRAASPGNPGRTTPRSRRRRRRSSAASARWPTSCTCWAPAPTPWPAPAPRRAPARPHRPRAC